MKKFMKSFCGFLGKTVADLVIGIVAVAGIIWVFMYHPSVIKTMMDYNLNIIEWATGFLNGNWGPQVETIVRAALSGDRMLLLLEGMLLIKAITFLTKWGCKCSYHYCCKIVKKDTKTKPQKGYGVGRKVVVS